MSESYHVPVLLNECIEGLNINPKGTYVDVTFGGGGHSREILKHLTTGKLIAFDQDDDAEKNIINDKHFHFVKANFRFFKNYLNYYKINKVDGILADLGISSHHINSEDRGFSFRFEGELDMRMNQNSDFSAKVLLNTYSVDELIKLFREYGEINNAGKLGYAIDSYRKANKLETIPQFLEAINQCVPKFNNNKYLAQVFQSLRIEVNKEMDVLKEFLLQTGEMIKPSGRLVVITYHSLEDRLVKNYMKSGNFEGAIQKDYFGNNLVPFDLINKKVIVPSNSELDENNRSRSAKLRIAAKNEEVKK